MTEQEIREQTRLIMDAYMELTGDPSGPSIPEFLQLRAAAITELGAVRPSTGKRRAEPAYGRGRNAERETLRPVPAVPPDRPEKAGSVPAASAQTIKPQTIQPETRPAEPEASRSDFDILRAIKDPWN